MKIPVCDRCKAKNIEGIICRHCDTAYCYDCLDANPPDMKICPTCGQFLCNECYEGMIACDQVPLGK
ncbi:MAG: hypothetical protein PWP41_538 [Moorella sp. (in: firmicutes)]|uniref:Uncharacterized protein n=1 Tax=Neomoorella thermoacetica TaxID=1525 RepID=A0A1J5NNP5_NEOTH|nr:hypothetical protein [Moorella sp. (in: firmicutes)]OIQ60410.1 hypothetical protein MOTE_08160 [Moorella thermoacetica]